MRWTPARMFRRRNASQNASREGSSPDNARPMSRLRGGPGEAFRPLSVATGCLPPRRRAKRALPGVSRSRAVAERGSRYRQAGQPMTLEDVTIFALSPGLPNIRRDASRVWRRREAVGLNYKLGG